MERLIFKDPALNKRFTQEGYVILQLLTPSEVGNLLAYFHELSEPDRNVFTTFVTDNLSAKRDVDFHLKSLLTPHFERLFVDYEPFWGNFFIKPINGSSMPLHADLQYVDEPKNISFNIWCPLQNTNDVNGSLGIVPYSHLKLNQIRGTNITKAYRYNALTIQQKFGEVLSLIAGEAIIYDHRLLHYSVSNTSTNTRIAITMVGTPKGVQKLHYYALDEDTTRVEKFYITSADDLMQAGFQNRPSHLTPVEVISDHQIKPLVPEDFE
jgi:hypothetical protein